VRDAFDVEGVSSPIAVCCSCGLGRFEPALGEAEIAAAYPPGYYGDLGAKFTPGIEWAVRLVGARRARFLSRGLSPGARILDVGCGRGVLLGAEAVQGADPRARIRIAPRLEAAGFPAEHFDQVVVWHVLEHVPEPRATLAEIRRVLRPGGRLVVAVPNFSSWQARWAGPAWFHLDPPRHLYHFPLAGLLRLLDGAGFRVLSAHHFSLRQNPFGWLQSAQNRIRGLPVNGLYEMLHHRAAGLAAPFPAPLARRMLLAAALAAPLALGLSVLAALARRGATVHVVSTRS
jgi:SAM-dependent methyltransferase